MQRIYKYSLALSPYQDIEMPADSTILSLQTQRTIPCLWAVVDPDKPPVNRRFLTFGTGHEVNLPPGKSTFIGTYQVEQGQFIFHVFEVEILE